MVGAEEISSMIMAVIGIAIGHARKIVPLVIMGARMTVTMIEIMTGIDAVTERDHRSHRDHSPHYSDSMKAAEEILDITLP